MSDIKRIHSVKRKAGFMAAILLLAVSSCAKAQTLQDKSNVRTEPIQVSPPIVTFIELGSVNCIPCKAMQPIMDELRKNYPAEVKVVFYDVWTPPGEPFGKQYRIRVIPTQVFLDASGKEFFRHEGFFPMEELKKVLARAGVKV